MSPLISIIVPVYNAESTLNRCIDSIVNQSFDDWELLLIDDGSRDRSGKICDEYAAKDSRIKVFHKENGGVSSARNIGLENSNGQWVTFCDSDDWVYSDWIDNYDLKSNYNYDLISQSFETEIPVFESEEFKEKYIYGLKYSSSIPEIIYDLEKSKTIGFLWIKAFKLSIIRVNNITFDTRLNNGEDYKFIYEYLCYCKLSKGVDKVGYHYNVPCWEKKYNKDFLSYEIIGKSLYKSACVIMREFPNSELVRHYREDLTSKYIAEFEIRKENRNRCLKGLRAILKNDFWNSQLFFLTRLVIYIDFSYIISSLALKCHLIIKRR